MGSRMTYLTLPPTLCSLLKLKNHYRRRYQRTRLPMYYHLSQLFSQVFSTQLSRLRNMKGTSFLRTLHPQSSQFWKIAHYFMNPTLSIPPLDPTWEDSLPHSTQSWRIGSSVWTIPPPHPKHGNEQPLPGYNAFCQQILSQNHPSNTTH
jgi:hypothetical protein